MNKPKVVIIQSSIRNYRVPVFNELAKHVDLTLVFHKGDAPDNIEFTTKKVDIVKIKYLKNIHKFNVYSYIQNYDVAIVMLDPSYLTTLLLSKFRGKTSLIFWGIGVAAAYNMRYDACDKTANVLKKLISKADAALFYSDYPVKKYTDMGIATEKLFVANNTVEVLQVEEAEKTDILFVGSLYKAKKIFELLDNYNKAYIKNSNIPKLIVVGNGEEYTAVDEWIENNNLKNKVILTGEIFDEELLSKYFAKAIMCISPDQAGLSVLKSFGYGVPFVTHKDAITGGERFNIINNENGILFEDFDDIENIIIDSVENKEKYIIMGQNAKEHYYEKRTISDMVNGFLQAINYVCDKKK